MISDKIVSLARSFIGQEELPNNSGFIDVIFEAKMRSVGWKTGQSWCAYFPKYIWLEANKYNQDTVYLINKYFMGHAVATYYNFKKSPEFAVRDYPVIGAVAIWRSGKTMNGHAGIVTSFTDSDFKTIEGNTHKEGELEAKEVAERFRELYLPYSDEGLNLLGFIHPIRLK